MDAGMAGFDVGLAESEAAGDPFGCARNLVGRVNTYFIPGYLRAAREALLRAEPAILALGNPGLFDEWNSIRAAIAMVYADHAGMRSAMDSIGSTRAFSCAP